MKVLCKIVFVVALTFAGQKVAAEPHTTRIEPRTVYGAIVTYEEGVRVFRPLPREQHVIINPRGSTPLVIGVDGGAAGFIAHGQPALPPK